MKLVVEGDVVKVMDLSCSKILNSVICDVQLDKLIQIASDSSCVMWVRALIETGQRIEPPGTDKWCFSKGPYLWSGRECQKSH